MPCKPVLCLMVILASAARADAPSPYAGQESREIKALSQQEISELLTGQGMGFAKAAELNGYPGPAHVLELAVQLELDEDQLSATEVLFREMQDDAVQLGRRIVELERRLDRQFAAHSVTPESLQQSLEKIGKLRSRLRRVHLHAHLEQYRLLSESQIANYMAIRGYAAHGGHERH
jgi:hypothetical protein